MAGRKIFFRLGFYSLLGGFALVTLILVVRRMSGALVTPLEFLPALLGGFLLAVGSWVLRRSVEFEPCIAVRRQLHLFVISLTWLLALGTTLSGMNPLAVLALWLPLIAMECSWHVLQVEQDTTPTAAVEDTSPSNGHEARIATPATEAIPPQTPLAQNLSQQLTRTRDAAGERISGLVRIEFLPEEQTAALHLAFCPPLERDPQVTVAFLAGTEFTIKATECRSYGVRLEARRGRTPSSALATLARFEAITGHVAEVP